MSPAERGPEMPLEGLVRRPCAPSGPTRWEHTVGRIGHQSPTTRVTVPGSDTGLSQLRGFDGSGSRLHRVGIMRCAPQIWENVQPRNG